MQDTYLLSMNKNLPGAATCSRCCCGSADMLDMDVMVMLDCEVAPAEDSCAEETAEFTA